MTDGSFSRALERRAVVEILDARTGEMFDVASADHEDLIVIFQALQNAEKRYREWRTVAEAELVQRFGERRAAQPVGEWEVNVRHGWSREWDVEEVEALAGDLVSRGAVSLADVSDLIVEKRTVNGTKAQKLLNRLSGQDLATFSEAFTWIQKGRPKVEITPSSSLGLARGAETREAR